MASSAGSFELGAEDGAASLSEHLQRRGTEAEFREFLITSPVPNGRYAKGLRRTRGAGR